MQRKIALEEHFAVDDTLMDSAPLVQGDHWTELRSRLLDLHGRRIDLMDRHGIERMILSLNAPAVQAIPDLKRANEVARRANDILAAEVAKRPDRFSAFAALPMQDPDLAIRELERCVQLGFKGALVNGFSQVGDDNTMRYYDLPQYWAFGQETAVHALRLMGSGLFDAHPRLTIILGHMGEGLPYSMWRVDNCNAWLKLPPRHKGKKKIAEYFSKNFYLTTSGNFRTQTLVDALLEV